MQNFPFKILTPMLFNKYTMIWLFGGNRSCVSTRRLYTISKLCVVKICTGLSCCACPFDITIIQLICTYASIQLIFIAEKVLGFDLLSLTFLTA